MTKFCDFERAASILSTKLNDDFIGVQDVHELIKSRELDLVVFFPKPIFLLRCVERTYENDFAPVHELNQTWRGCPLFQVENSLFCLLFVDVRVRDSKKYYLQCDVSSSKAIPIKDNGYGSYQIIAPSGDFQREFGFRLHEVDAGDSHHYTRGDPFVLKNDEGIFMLENPYKGIPQFAKWGVSVESLERYCKGDIWKSLSNDEKQEQAIQAYQEAEAKNISLEVIAKRLGTTRQTLYEWGEKTNKPRAPLEQIVQSLKKSK